MSSASALHIPFNESFRRSCDNAFVKIHKCSGLLKQWKVNSLSLCCPFVIFFKLCPLLPLLSMYSVTYLNVYTQTHSHLDPNLERLSSSPLMASFSTILYDVHNLRTKTMCLNGKQWLPSPPLQSKIMAVARAPGGSRAKAHKYAFGGLDRAPLFCYLSVFTGATESFYESSLWPMPQKDK